MDNITDSKLQSLITRAYQADPDETEADLKAVAGERGELEWLYMLGKAKEGSLIETVKSRLPAGVTKVGRHL